jgi:hypothetical protein
MNHGGSEFPTLILLIATVQTDAKSYAAVCTAVHKTTAISLADARICNVSATVAMWRCGGSKPPLNPLKTATNNHISCSVWSTILLKHCFNKMRPIQIPNKTKKYKILICKPQGTHDSNNRTNK